MKRLCSLWVHFHCERYVEISGPWPTGFHTLPFTCYHSLMIEWTPSLSTGNEVLDEQHKAIFRWLAELDSAASDSRRASKPFPSP